MALQHWCTNFISSRSVFKYSFCIFLNSWYCSSITLSPIWQGWNVISLLFCKLILNEKIIGLMLKLKLQYFGYLMQKVDLLEKTLMLGKIEGKRKRRQKDDMVGCHHWLNGYKFELTPGDSEGQGSLACCSSCGRKELDMTETEQKQQHN